MDKHNIPGLSVAIARRGQFVYQAGFGYADKTSDQLVIPAHLFRIASVTKPITSVALFTLVELGRLKLDDLVFGGKGVLGFDYGHDYSERVSRITIHHLLTHTAAVDVNPGQRWMGKRWQRSNVPQSEDEPQGTDHVGGTESTVEERARAALRLFKLRLLYSGSSLGKGLGAVLRQLCTPGRS